MSDKQRITSKEHIQKKDTFMPFKKLVDKIKNHAEKSLSDSKDPKKKAEKQLKNAMLAAGIAKKGIDTAKKAEEISKNINEKAIELAEDLKPTAEKADEAISSAADKTKETLETTKNKLSGIFSKAKETLQKKKDERQKNKKDHPSSGSSIVDIISPVIPKNKDNKGPKNN